MKNYEGVTLLAKRYVENNNVTMKEAEDKVKKVLEVFRVSLLDPENDGIQVMDFLTLQKVIRKSKLARNPQNREEVIIPERQGIKVNLGKTFDNDFNR